MRVLWPAILVCSAALGAAPGGRVTMENVVARDGAYELAPAPNVDGVVYLKQGGWSPAEVRAFHEVPWIDAASSRVRWADLEPRDQQFSWRIFDGILSEVRRWNAAHPGSPRTMHIRPMGGVHCPAWFERAGVRYYDTMHSMGPERGSQPIRVPMPYDNPEFLEQLRQLYCAMVERYGDDPLVTVYHGTWSAGPWDEIFHPEGGHPLPPDYTPGKFVNGMLEQLDVLIDELCLKGKVAELPFSGKYPQKSEIDITGPIVDRIVERLGKRTPYLYIQSNGWGRTSRGLHTVSWGHERDINEAFGRVNLSLQALGTNAGGGWWPQGDWVELIKLAERYQVAYVELYPPDFMPVDTEHRMPAAFLQTAEEARSGEAGAVPGFIGFKPWLRERNRTLYAPEGRLRIRFVPPTPPARAAQIDLTVETPPDTDVSARIRMRTADGWSDWVPAAQAAGLPEGEEAEVDVMLRTRDGYATPRLRDVRVRWQ
jgi:hypothetical protein